MFKKRLLVRVLTLLTLLVFVAGSSGGIVVEAQDTLPPDGSDGLSATQGGEAGVSNTAKEEPLVVPAAAGMVYQSFSSMMFAPDRDTTQFAYNFTYGTQHLTAGSSSEFHMPLVLPQGAEVREITYWFRDNQPVNLTMGLCRVQHGEAAALCIIPASQPDTTGINTTSVVARTVTGSPITTIDNVTYGYFLLVSVPWANPQLGLVSVRLGYTYPGYMPAIQR